MIEFQPAEEEVEDSGNPTDAFEASGAPFFHFLRRGEFLSFFTWRRRLSAPPAPFQSSSSTSSSLTSAASRVADAMRRDASRELLRPIPMHFSRCGAKRDAAMLRYSFFFVFQDISFNLASFSIQIADEIRNWTFNWPRSRWIDYNSIKLEWFAKFNIQLTGFFFINEGFIIIYLIILARLRWNYRSNLMFHSA